MFDRPLLFLRVGPLPAEVDLLVAKEIDDGESGLAVHDHHLPPHLRGDYLLRVHWTLRTNVPNQHSYYKVQKPSRHWA